MLKLRSYFMAVLAVTGMAVLTSCGDDGDDPKPKPVITFTPGDETATKDAGDIVTLQVSVTSESNLKEFKAERFILGNGDLLNSTSSFPGAGFTYNLTDTIPGDAQPGNKVEYRFTATNKDNQTTTKSLTITVGGAANTYNGVLYNIAGPQKGAFDLVANAGVSSSGAAADKDMINTTPTSGSNAAVFTPSWTAGNSTMYIKAPTGVTYENATKATISAAYTAGSPMQTVNNVAVNDVYIAKLRGGDTWAVIKITGIENDNQVGTNKNNDNISFLYKKF